MSCVEVAVGWLVVLGLGSWREAAASKRSSSNSWVTVEGSRTRDMEFKVVDATVLTLLVEMGMVLSAPTSRARTVRSRPGAIVDTLVDFRT